MIGINLFSAASDWLSPSGGCKGFKGRSNRRACICDPRLSPGSRCWSPGLRCIVEYALRFCPVRQSPGADESCRAIRLCLAATPLAFQLQEPIPQARAVFGGELGYLIFELFEFVHKVLTVRPHASLLATARCCGLKCVWDHVIAPHRAPWRHTSRQPDRL